MESVSVINWDGGVLAPCTPARARTLLKRGRAVALQKTPFTIKLKKPQIEEIQMEKNLNEQALQKIISDLNFQWDETKSPENALAVRVVGHTIREHALAHMLDRIPTFSEVVSILQAYGAPLCQINCSLSNGCQVIAAGEWVVYIKKAEPVREKHIIDDIAYFRHSFKDGSIVITIDIPPEATDDNIRSVSEYLSSKARTKPVEDTPEAVTP